MGILSFSAGLESLDLRNGLLHGLIFPAAENLRWLTLGITAMLLSFTLQKTVRAAYIAYFIFLVVFVVSWLGVLYEWNLYSVMMGAAILLSIISLLKPEALFAKIFAGIAAVLNFIWLLDVIIDSVQYSISGEPIGLDFTITYALYHLCLLTLPWYVFLKGKAAPKAGTVCTGNPPGPGEGDSA
jgi:hypothetical protein